MCQSRNGGIPQFIERIEVQLGVIVFLLASERQKLFAKRIAIRVIPIDQAQNIRRNPHTHGRVLQARCDLLIKRIGYPILEYPHQFAHAGYGMAHLKDVRVKGACVYICKCGDVPPKFIPTQRAMREVIGIDGWFCARGIYFFNNVHFLAFCFLEKSGIHTFLGHL